ncbi:glycosyltransferase family 2 protein [Patescibacteria group bacterium]
MKIKTSLKCSAIIPVFNSEPIVGKTIEHTESFFRKNKLNYEIILVNDGSLDQSWNVLKKKASQNKKIIAINLLKNYGQHTAVYCGLKVATGDLMITLDDDFQNPPEEIIKLIEKTQEGHDLVFGKYPDRQHAFVRKFGSWLIDMVNNKVFIKPKDLQYSGFKIIKKEVAQRICSYQTAYPYINGLATMFAENPTNALVKHRKRTVGKSNYKLTTIIKLITRILFNYSSYPLRLVTAIGMVISALSFILGAFLLIKALLLGTTVPGWASIIVFLSCTNGLMLLIISMLGEYLIRLVNQASAGDNYHIKESINHEQ